MFQFIRTDESVFKSARVQSVENVVESVGSGEDSHAVAVAAPDVAAVGDSAPQKARAPRLVSDVSRLDRAGATASFICAIHCAVMPLVIAMLPLVGLSFLASEPTEWALLAASAALGSWSLCLGFRQHRSRLVFVVLGVALALLLAGRLFHQPHMMGAHLHDHHAGEPHFGVWGVVLMVLGGLTMMSAHLLNHRLCHACKECSTESCH